MQSRIKRQKAEIASRSSDIARLHQKKDQLNKNNNDLELQIKELDFKIKELQTEASECAKKVRSFIILQAFSGINGVNPFSGVAEIFVTLKVLLSTHDDKIRVPETVIPYGA